VRPASASSLLQNSLVTAKVRRDGSPPRRRTGPTGQDPSTVDAITPAGRKQLEIALHHLFLPGTGPSMPAEYGVIKEPNPASPALNVGYG
jgi:hypothetical protein